MMKTRRKATSSDYLVDLVFDFVDLNIVPLFLAVPLSLQCSLKNKKVPIWRI